MSIRDIAYKILFAGPGWCWLVGHSFYIGASFMASDDLLYDEVYRCDCGATKVYDAS